MRYSFKQQHSWMCEGDQAEYVIVFQKIKINQQRQIPALEDGTCLFGLFLLGPVSLKKRDLKDIKHHYHPVWKDYLWTSIAPILVVTEPGDPRVPIFTMVLSICSWKSRLSLLAKVGERAEGTMWAFVHLWELWAFGTLGLTLNNTHQRKWSQPSVPEG